MYFFVLLLSILLEKGERGILFKLKGLQSSTCNYSPFISFGTSLVTWVTDKDGCTNHWYKKWDKMDEIHEGPIIQTVRDKFEIVDYDEDEEVRKGVNKKCKTLYKSWRNKIKTHYSKLVDAGVDPCSKPYKGVDYEAWVYMINHVWLDGDHQNLAEKATDSRSRLPYNHTMDSKSFQAAMYKQGTEKTDIVDFYKDSYWSKRKSDWVTPICRQLHESLKKRREESSEPRAVPLTQEQLSIEVLGKKSGYLKGFEVGPKPSSSGSSISAQTHIEVVSSLQKQLESLKNLSEVQQEQIAAQNLVAQQQAKMIEMQNKIFEEIEKFMRMQKDWAGMEVDEDDYQSEESYYQALCSGCIRRFDFVFLEIF